MKQILQSLKTGATEVVDIPCPSVKSRQLLIRATCSLISAGTERMLIDFGKANPIEKARQQPDKVRMVLDKIKTDGLLPTIDAVRGKLEQPLSLGYCNVGEILEVGKGVDGFTVGDRVASNGKHAEVVSVPVNLCAKIPNNVSNDEAAFTVVGAIALQGIRLTNPTLGEVVVVTGLGLIGQLAVQLLRANGCRVLGIDFDADKLAIAKSFGAEVVNLGAGEDPVKAAELFSRGRGADAVLITAATQSSEPMHQAALMCRKRGRIVLVGVTGLELARDDFFKKELTFQVSASYGPGRYDPNYEEKGQDYPVGFVRWTEQRNFEAVLDMLADGRLDVMPLISHRFNLEQMASAYAIVAGSEPSMGVMLNYHTRTERPDDIIREQTVSLTAPLFKSARKPFPNFSFIGSGNYATAVLIPAFKKAGAHLGSIASSSGVSGVHAGKKYGFEETTTGTIKLFDDKDINVLVISTRHDSHATLVLQALRAGKSVFVEKPLCLTRAELDEIEQEYAALKVRNKESPILMVGFNRRFAPQVQKIKSLLLAVSGPKSFVMTVNAGTIPMDHWTQDIEIGGGRIIGEACHFIDLLRFLSGSPITGWQSIRMDCVTRDTASVQLQFADGSIGTIHYFANGSKVFPKERLEIFSSGSVLQLDNFRKLTGYGWPGFKKMNLWKQDKGQNACAKAFVDAITQNISSPISAEELFEVSRAAIEISEAAN
jgi:predicted dehydrogenase/threonine dehydrogenase-like Zn-dependent dehydrogenase